jgi:hypothetical protein
MARAKKEVEEKVVGLPEQETANPVISDDNFIDESIIEEIQDTITEPQMKEKKVIEPEKETGLIKLRWKKIGGGSLRGVAGCGIIKPGQVFDAFLSDIPQMFLKSLQCLDADLLAGQMGQVTKPAPKENIWKVQQLKVGAWNVINRHTDKPINVTPLPTQEDADNLCKALNN